MLQICGLSGRKAGDVDGTELRLAAEIGVKQHVYDSMLRIDFEFG